MNKKSTLYKTLKYALGLKRPHKSQTNIDFTNWLATAMPECVWDKSFIDACGNLHVDYRTESRHRTLFVSHVDTVHKVEGKNNITMTATKWSACGAPLGADDGAGIALLMHMMHEGVNGYYIFTQGEEVGGIGAKYVAKNYPDLLAEFDRAIAFDRRGIDSVITHQGWSRCCSDVFAQELSDALNVDGHTDVMMYSPDDSGVYTDTAEFVDIIPECTNISVGYDREHSEFESLDLVHYEQLSKQVLLIDWDALPTSRDPSVHESKWDQSDYTYGGYTYNWDKTTDNSFSYGKDMMSYKECFMADVQDALLDAQIGMCDFLLELMAEAVYPEDVGMAIKMIDRSRMTDDWISEALARAWVEDPDTLLIDLFDSVYAYV